MDGLKSKFDFDIFYDEWEDRRYFAANRDKYTREAAIALWEQETDGAPVFEVREAAVRWGVGGKIDGEPRVGWWLEFHEDGNKPRLCPVWVIRTP